MLLPQMIGLKKALFAARVAPHLTVVCDMGGRRENTKQTKNNETSENFSFFRMFRLFFVCFVVLLLSWQRALYLPSPTNTNPAQFRTRKMRECYLFVLSALNPVIVILTAIASRMVLPH
jgi:hypothetical protein